MTTIGSLFTGYGGLDMAVRMALDPSARVAWTSDIDAGLLPDDADRFLDGPHTVIADRLAAKRFGVPMYEVRVLVYADTDTKESK